MVTTIEIKREMRNPSKVIVGDALGLLPEMVPPGRRVVAVTDPNVDAIYGDTIRAVAGEVIVIPTGEENKTFATVEAIHRRLVEIGADRRTYIVGVGGGITTDVTGFAASTYLRGVEFGFVATSLLAQVDASVGGKNGVNVAGFKNMAGVFNQPDFVLCDTGVLATLPPREFRAGLAEMIKAGIIADPALFETFERHSPEDLLADPKLLTEAITAAIRVKAAIVDADEREAGERRKLNLGHTVAHAIEKLSRRYNHGEAVGAGLVAIAGISERLGLLAANDRNRIVRAVQKAGLPTSTGIPGGEMAQALTRDKKVEGDALWLVTVRAIGDVDVRRTPIDELAALL
ncbi:MAG: 3-dehydroquinate synthase [Alistipes sp.]|jgi:3-dehydroquinate synthase|nr:3-dehydroquinate synthase [Alistipes sp.]